MSRQKIPWTRVLIEGVVIVASILLAFGLQAWWEDQQEQERELVALVDLQSDLLADSADLEGVRRNMQSWDAAAYWVDQHVGQDLPSDSVATQLRRLLFFSLYQPVNAAYAGLRDSGHLSLLRNQDLRRQVVRYYEERQPYMLQLGERVKEQQDGFIAAYPEVIELRASPNRTSMLGARTILHRPWSEVNRRSPVVIAALGVGMLATQYELRVGQVIDDASALLDSIRVELGS